MKTLVERDTLTWYQQFSHNDSEIIDAKSPNFFIPIKAEELQNFEKSHGNILPYSYINFLRVVGHGRLTKDINNIETNNFDNYFIRPCKIAKIMMKKTNEWRIYEEFIALDEIPFFYIGDNSVLVFRKNCGSRVYFPFLKEIYAENFEEFIDNLMKDVTFYKNI